MSIPELGYIVQIHNHEISLICSLYNKYYPLQYNLYLKYSNVTNGYFL